MKILSLVTTGFRRPDRAELRRMELEDEHPRVLLFEEMLNSDILDERFLEHIPAFRKLLYRPLPIFMRQLIEAYVLRHRYDAIFSWSEKLGMVFAFILKLTASRVPHVVLFSWISKPKKARLLRFVHSHIDKVILCSTYQREFAIHHVGIPSSKIVLSRWGVDQVFFRPMTIQTDMICAVGLEMRDYQTLIEAMRGLDIRCHIAAGTGRRLKGENQIDDRDKSFPSNVTVARKNYRELRDLYARSRFVVVPIRASSDTDHGTTTILEAMAMGKPVICSQTKGQRDVIQNGKTGVFVPAGDAKALREAILRLWNNPGEAACMGLEARAYVEANHRLEGFFGQIGQAVQEAIASRVCSLKQN